MSDGTLSALAALTPKLTFMGHELMTGSTSECLAVLAKIVEEQRQRIEELEAMVWPCGK